jgi:hypothetical protein
VWDLVKKSSEIIYFSIYLLATKEVDERRKRHKKVKRNRKSPRRRQQRRWRLFLNGVKVVWLLSPKKVTHEGYLNFTGH